MNTFDQLLDMDDEDDHEFSYSIVQDYFKQAEVTFEDMDAAL
jgi:osomolarity two-component system phosphorelay intermediate protein YPD1